MGEAGSAETRAVVDRVRSLTVGHSGSLLVAIDGRSGAGKSTLAAAVGAGLDSLVIDGDDFYSGGDASEWDAMTAAEKAAHCIDWRRQRPVLEALSRQSPATWRAYDWDANDGRWMATEVQAVPSAVVILEGVYSGRPELADLFDLRIVVEVPDRVRLSRLRRREGEDYDPLWAARWEEAERHYFSKVMRPGSFEVVVRPCATEPP